MNPNTETSGKPTIVKECVGPAIAHLAIVEVTERGQGLKVHAPGWRVRQIRPLTEPKLIAAEYLRNAEF